jgi:hypothetical protein
MDYRVLTVSRELGSGRGQIAQFIARRLGLEVAGALIDEIACAAKVDTGLVCRFDEHVEGWLSCINRQAMRCAALAAGVALADEKYFDPDVIAILRGRLSSAPMSPAGASSSGGSTVHLAGGVGHIPGLYLCVAARPDSPAKNTARTRRPH